ncbi:Metalloendoproteinase [Quillaja saponaria]|uniref:Metalloendoproteinase n=1 Tax=Quillaja saponaria TaxID=32244 RepID=A0AAD7PXQ3_QUISA|nr:Metalloendoproteinase [Quillaja saponaria]
MKIPRCGVPDIHDLNTLGMVSHYKFFPGKPRWPQLLKYESNILYYSLDVSHASGVSLEIMRYIATEAFSQWTNASNFTFEEAAQGTLPNLLLGFVQNDGPGHILAFSYRPTNGTTRFDAAESWSADIPPAKTDFDFIWVAMHEIGHLLGLDHSTEKSAIMYAYIDPGVNKKTLSQDDIDDIRALYSS